MYKAIILHAVLNLRSLISREEDRLRVFENRMLVGVFGLNRGGVVGGWRKLHNEDLSNLYSSVSVIRLNKSRRLRWEEQVACMVRRKMHIKFSWERQNH
jgi:hypothetical protein